MSLPPELERTSARAQLPLAKLAARPRARDRDEDERDRVPLGPEGGAGIPRRDETDGAHDDADDADRHGVPYRPVGREPRRDVAAEDAEEDAICRCEAEERIGH